LELLEIALTSFVFSYPSKLSKLPEYLRVFLLDQILIIYYSLGLVKRRGSLVKETGKIGIRDVEFVGKYSIIPFHLDGLLDSIIHSNVLMKFF